MYFVFVQITASILRNLSWRADSQSKDNLREVGAVKALMEVAMSTNKETTLKSFLSAIWNLSAHSTENKVLNYRISNFLKKILTSFCVIFQNEICGVEGAIEFLTKTLGGIGPFKSVAIIENASGIMRNISSVIAFCEEYR